MYFFSYQKYRRTWVETLQSEVYAAGLADRMRGNFNKRSWKMLWSYLDSIRFTVLSLNPGDSCSAIAFLASGLLQVVRNKLISNKAEA
jgi:hypothetical protein